VARNSVTVQRERDIINLVRGLVALSILCVSVLGARYVGGLSEGLAVLVGGSVAYLVGTVVSRYLPKPPAITDEERLNLPSVGRWLFVVVILSPLIHFGVRISWAWSIGTLAVVAVCFIAAELEKRSRARRLKQAELAD
jgi:hypothetical protein